MEKDLESADTAGGMQKNVAPTEEPEQGSLFNKDDFVGHEENLTTDFIRSQLITQNKKTAIPYLMSEPSDKSPLGYATHAKHQAEVLIQLFHRQALQECEGSLSPSQENINGLYESMGDIEPQELHFSNLLGKSIFSQEDKVGEDEIMKEIESRAFFKNGLAGIKSLKEEVGQDQRILREHGLEPDKLAEDILLRKWWRKLYLSIKENYRSLAAAINLAQSLQATARVISNDFIKDIYIQVGIERSRHCQTMVASLYKEMLPPLLEALARDDYLNTALHMECDYKYDISRLDTYLTHFTVFCKKCGHGKDKKFDATYLREGIIRIPPRCAKCDEH
ncbi:hypothetical protein KJ969_01790 [Patescibacteria group bacterium]|nr:hypothetical protein [Patescibacteria group bacterium]MBU1922462.1 hypothetical protein [Patescibacteria group bacterium]